MDQQSIDHLTTIFFDLFTNTDGKQPNWNAVREACIPQALIIKKTGLKQDVYDLQAFIEPRRKILSDGTLTEFSEWEVSAETRIIGHIAQRFSQYRKKGLLNGQPFDQLGNKIFQFVKTRKGWKIVAVVWEDA